MEICMYVMWDVYDYDGKIIAHFEEEFPVYDKNTKEVHISIGAEKRINYGEEFYICKVNTIQVISY